MKPFRWDVRRREQLGRLVESDFPKPYDGFFTDLRECAARTVASAGDARIVFIGRSPESLFDYLSGVLDGTTRESRLELVNLSLRWMEELEGDPAQLFRQHLEAHHLTPEAIATGDVPVTLCDLVASGSTFEAFVRELERWAADIELDVAAVRRRLRIVGITWRQKTSPNTWRWHQHAPWRG